MRLEPVRASSTKCFPLARLKVSPSPCPTFPHSAGDALAQCCVLS